MTAGVRASRGVIVRLLAAEAGYGPLPLRLTAELIPITDDAAMLRRLDRRLNRGRWGERLAELVRATTAPDRDALAVDRIRTREE